MGVDITLRKRNDYPNFALRGAPTRPQISITFPDEVGRNSRTGKKDAR
jgi:hypothetical protein